MARKQTSIIDRQMNEAKKRLEAKNETQQKPAENQANPEKIEPQNMKVETVKPEIKKVEKPKGDSVITNTPLLEESVNRTGRDYTKLEINGEAPDRTEVPVFTRPKIDLPTGSGEVSESGESSEGKEPKTSSSGGGGNEPPNKPKVIHNDGDSGETPRESKKKAEQAVEAAIFAWDFLWGQVGRMIELSPDKLEKKSLKGLIDLRILDKQLDDGRSVGQVIAEYNAKVGEETAPDEEFNEDLRPFLVRIFKEKGWGLSDDQYVLFKIAVKMIERVIRLISMNAMVTGMLKKESQDYIQAHGAPRGKQKAVIPEAETNTISPEPVTEKDLGKNAQKQEPETVEYAEIMPPGTLDTEDANRIIAKNQTFTEGE